MLRELIARDGVGAVVVAGYSLGGNLALKLAGDLGRRRAARAQAAFAPCRRRWIWRGLRRRTRAPAEYRLPVELRARAEGAHAPQGALVPGTVRRRAPRTGADRPRVRRALHRAALRFSAARPTTTIVPARCASIDRIAVPALIITAADDPFVPTEPFLDAGRSANPNIRSSSRQHGGHCALRQRGDQWQRRVLGGAGDRRLRRGADARRSGC